MNYRIVYSNELYHHGVKGMKWGVRKEYVPKGRKKASGSQDTEKKRKGLSRNQKIALGIAAVAVTGVVLYKTGSFDKIAQIGKNTVNGSDILSAKAVGNAVNTAPPMTSKQAISQEFKDLAEATGLKLHDSIPSIEDAAKNANSFGESDNCGFNVISYFMNRKGINCASNPYPIDGSPTIKELGLYMKGQKLTKESINPGDYASVHDQLTQKIMDLSERTPGAIGGLGVHKVRPDGSRKGHILAWENVGGKIQFTDPSNSSLPGTKWIEGLAKGQFDLNDVEIVSYHNVAVNPRQITKAVRNRD